MADYVFLGDSITDADHLFEPSGLGTGFVSMIAQDPRMKEHRVRNMGHDGFTMERIHRMLLRDGIPPADVITILAGVNDIPVEVYTGRNRIPEEFTFFCEEIFLFLSRRTDTRLVVMEPFLFDCPAEYRNWHPYVEEESRILRQMAEKFHACFIPTDRLLRRRGEEEGLSAITIDGIHLTGQGNRILADLWFENLISPQRIFKKE